MMTPVQRAAAACEQHGWNHDIVPELAAEIREAEQVASHETWRIAHEPLPKCGHPRACWQDVNWPESEANYDPETRSSNQPMVYRCVACEAVAAEREACAKIAWSVEYGITGQCIADAIRARGGDV